MKKYYYVCDMCGKEITTDGPFYYAHIMCNAFKDIDTMEKSRIVLDSLTLNPNTYLRDVNFKCDMCEDCAKKFNSLFGDFMKVKKIMEGK